MILAVLTFVGLSLCGLAAWIVILPPLDMSADDLELMAGKAEGPSGDAADCA